MWRQAAKHRVPAIGFVNKMDRDGADFNMATHSVATKLGIVPLVLQRPVFNGPDGRFSGVVDVVAMKHYEWPDDDGDVTRAAGGSAGAGGSEDDTRMAFPPYFAPEHVLF